MIRGVLLRERRRPGGQVPPAASCSAVAERGRSLRGAGDPALLEAVGGPDSRAALGELFHRHGAAVHRLVSLTVADTEDVDRLVADVFVTLSRRAGRLEDDVGNVRLGLLAMAWRRSRPAADAPSDALVAPAGGAQRRLGCLPKASRDALALTVLSAATITEVAVVLQVDRQTLAAELRAGLRSASATRHRGGA